MLYWRKDQQLPIHRVLIARKNYLKSANSLNRTGPLNSNYIRRLQIHESSVYLYCDRPVISQFMMTQHFDLLPFRKIVKFCCLSQKYLHMNQCTTHPQFQIFKGNQQTLLIHLIREMAIVF